MIGALVLKNLYKIIHQHYTLNIADFDAQVDGNLWSNNDTIDALKGEAAIIARAKISELLDLFAEAQVGPDFMADNFVVPIGVELLDFSHGDFGTRNRAFGYSDAQFGCLSLKKILQYDHIFNMAATSADYRVLIDFIATSISNGNDGDVVNLLTRIENSTDNWVILIRKTVTPVSSLSIYSYLYFQMLLQNGEIITDKRLEYTGVHGASTVFSNQIVYEQYFEVFDIVNELNQANDIITRYLKLYHVLEYLVYRVDLVKIEEKARVNRTFIREIHGFTGKSQSDKEFEILKRNFKNLFEAEIAAGTFNVNPLTADERAFLKSSWNVDLPHAHSNFRHTEVYEISNLIYRIRNSIVHNKESEFHITTTNPDDYAVVIPFLQRFIPLIERQILDKISGDADPISYENRYIELY